MIVPSKASNLFSHASCTVEFFRLNNWSYLVHNQVVLTMNTWWLIKIIIKSVKWSRYRPGVAQKVGRGIAVLFHDFGTRRGWVVSSTPRPHFTPGKDPLPILQEAGWVPGPVWKGGKSCPHRDSIPDRTARSQPLNRLSYPALVKWNNEAFARYLCISFPEIMNF